MCIGSIVNRGGRCREERWPLRLAEPTIGPQSVDRRKLADAYLAAVCSIRIMGKSTRGLRAARGGSSSLPSGAPPYDNWIVC